VAFVPGIARTGVWPVIDAGIARRLGIGAIADAVVALRAFVLPRLFLFPRLLRFHRLLIDRFPDPYEAKAGSAFSVRISGAVYAAFLRNDRRESSCSRAVSM
jgi:hypothetical protein